jgi:hypothetical protein
MPCVSGYLEPTERERESARVVEFLHEIHGNAFNHERPMDPYGRVQSLDVDTRTLCEWCQTHDVTAMSLELQLWWQRHQKADAARRDAERAKIERDRLAAQGLAKLTPDERKALGIREDR